MEQFSLDDLCRKEPVRSMYDLFWMICCCHGIMVGKSSRKDCLYVHLFLTGNDSTSLGDILNVGFMVLDLSSLYQLSLLFLSILKMLNSAQAMIINCWYIYCLFQCWNTG